MSKQTITQNEFSSPEAKSWFANFLQDIKLDQLKLETNTADSAIRDIYADMIFGDGVESAKMVRATTTRHLVKTILLDYISHILDRKTHINKLAFDLSNDKILVWAEISDDDDEAEKNLTLAEAETNSTFFEETGMSIETTIVEEIDNLSVPPHYQEIELLND